MFYILLQVQSTSLLPLRFAPEEFQKLTDQQIITSPYLVELLRKADLERKFRMMSTESEFPQVSTSSRHDSITFSPSCSPSLIKFEQFPCIKSLLENPCQASASKMALMQENLELESARHLLQRQTLYMRDAHRTFQMLADNRCSMLGDMDHVFDVDSLSNMEEMDSLLRRTYADLATLTAHTYLMFVRRNPKGACSVASSSGSKIFVGCDEPSLSEAYRITTNKLRESMCFAEQVALQLDINIRSVDTVKRVLSSSTENACTCGKRVPWECRIIKSGVTLLELVLMKHKKQVSNLRRKIL